MYLKLAAPTAPPVFFYEKSMSRSLMFLVLLWLPMLAQAQRPPAVVPASADTVLERLPRGYAALAPAIAGAKVSMSDVQQLLTTAARTGDARLATRAEGLLSRFPANTRDTGILKARAFSAQHRHDFASALRLLDAVIRIDPRDADARLSRAQIQLVQGRIALARSDCAALALGVDADHGLICVASISQRMGDTAHASALLDRWLVQGAQDPGFRRYVLVMRAEAAARTHDADDWFRRALAMAPDDVRTLASYARYLRANGRPREVLTLLATAPESDGLQLQRALAAHAARSPDAQRLAKAQQRRYELAYAAGGEPELRDEAEFLLTLRNDAAGALKVALRNFESQRDQEDVDILRRAAFAAKRPDALRPLYSWAKSQQLPLSPGPESQP